MIKSYLGNHPTFGAEVFVAETAMIIGAVTAGMQSSFWYNCVVRGDIEKIEIGDRTNIQDGCVLHVSSANVGGRDRPLILGNDITVGHNATLHACVIENRCIIGMNACILDGVVVGEDSIVAAHSLLPPGKVYPNRSMIMGSPAKVVRTLTDEELELIAKNANAYVAYAKHYLAMQNEGQ